MLFRAISLTFAQLDDRAFLGAVAKALLVTLLIFAGIWRLAVWGMDAAVPETWPAPLSEFFGAAGAIVALWFAGPVTAAACVGLFVEDVAGAVERRHYPAAKAGDAPWLRSIAAGLRFAAIAFALNVLLLPAYFAPPPINIVAYLALNGYLVGREFFEVVALRHMPGAAARSLRRAHRGRIWMAGVIAAAPMAIPIIQIAAPVAAAAFMTHVFHRLGRI